MFRRKTQKGIENSVWGKIPGLAPVSKSFESAKNVRQLTKLVNVI